MEPPYRPKLPRVVVAGQTPPPVGGQNIMILRALEVLGAEPELEVVHLPFRFTREWSQVRAASLAKAVEVLRVMGRLARIRRAGAIDLLLYPSGGPHLMPILRDLALLPVCRLASRGVVLHFHAGGIAEAIAELPSPLAWLVRRVYRLARGAIVLTRFGRRDPEALGIDEIVVLPNTIPDTYSPEKVDVERSRGNGPILLYVGHLCEEKGTPQLLRAFSPVHAQHPDSSLVLVGEPLPPYTSEDLRREIDELGIGDSVHLAGVATGDDKWRWFAAADLFVFPTQAPYESHPLVVLEALMWGLPMVATRWRGVPELLGDPPPGVVFDRGTDMSRSMTAALLTALEGPERWSEWGRRARQRFLELQTLPDGRDPLAAFVGHLVSRPD